MSLSLKEVFDQQFASVKFDQNLIKAIYRYRVGYINQNREHLEFFGSNLLGVHVVRFKDADVTRFFELFDIDYMILTNEIRKVESVSKDYKIAGDVFNLTCMYIIHRLITSAAINDKQKDESSFDLGLIFFYRCVAAILSYYFKYPTDPKIAQAAYAQLSNKYLIKKLGTWHKVMEYRSEDLVGKKNLHYKNLYSFKDDLAVMYAISDSQGRVRDLIKNYCAEFYKIHEEGDTIASTSSSYLDADGEETTVEKTKSVESYVNYIRHTVIDKHSFIKDDLIDVIVSINTNTSKRIIRHTLAWIVERYNDGKLHKTIDEFLALVVVHSMFIIEHNVDGSKKRDYPYILSTIKNVYLSTRSLDPELTKIRDLGEIIVKEANGKTNNSLMLSTRTSIVLYLTLLAITGKNKH